MPVKINSFTQSTFLRRAFGLFSGFTLKLDETIVPVAVVEDATTPHRPGDRPCFGGAMQSGVAAEYGHVSLVNPAGTGVLVLLDKILVHSGNGTVAFYSGGSAGTTVNGSYRDSRLWTQAGVPQVPNARIMNHTNVAHLGTFRAQPLYTLSASHSLDLSLDLILGQGSDITIQALFVNITLDVLFFWRERPIET